MTYASLVAQIYSAALQPSRWRQVLDDLSIHFDATGANIVYMLSDGSPGVLASSSLEEPGRLYMSERWYANDVVVQRFGEHALKTGKASFRHTELLLPGEFETLPIYTEFYRRFDLGHLSSISVVGAFGVPAALGFHRSIAAGPFSDQAMADMVEIGRHVEAALKVSIEIVDRHIEATLLTDICSALDKGVVVLNHDGATRSYNDVAERLFSRTRLARGARFTVGWGEADRQIASHIAVAGSHVIPASSPPIVVPGTDRSPPVLLQVLPVGTDMTFNLSQSAHIVLASVVDRGKAIDQTLLRHLFGLTPAEARLASIAVLGDDIETLAKTLGIAAGTVKLVLQRIYKKTGVNRQAELVAKLAELTLPLALRELAVSVSHIPVGR